MVGVRGVDVDVCGMCGWCVCVAVRVHSVCVVCVCVCMCVAGRGVCGCVGE